MLIAHIHIEVLPELIEDFKLATLENAKNSIQEPGIARFDVIQSKDNPSSFVLMEAYYSIADQLKHKDTAHFKTWLDAVDNMLAAPRKPMIYNSVFPNDKGWE